MATNEAGTARKKRMAPRTLSRRAFLRWTLKAAGAAALSTFLPGCGPSPSESTVEPAGVGRRTLIIGSAVDLYTLDPAVGFDQAIGSSLKGLYDALFRYVGNPPQVIPWLAQSYEVSEDATEWTFKLVENAVFHDGSPVTAEAVRYSVQRLLRIGEGAASLFTGVIDEDSVVVEGDYVVKFRLLQPFGPFLNILPWLFIVNPRLVEANAGGDEGRSWLKDHDAGSGPFTVGEWRPGEMYEFKAVPSYWKGWPAESHLEGYIRQVISDSAARVQALEQGEVDLIDWATPEDQLRLREEGFVIVDEPTMQVYEIKLNNQEGYTANVHVRRAISYAFDYQALQEIWGGRATLNVGPLPTTLELTAKDLEVYRLDLEKARAELSRSPWPEGGFSLDFVYVNGLEEERRTGEILREQLAKININVNIIPMAWADAVSSFQDPKTAPPMFPLYSVSAYPDPDNYLWTGYHSSQAGVWSNPGHYKNPQMDELLERARATVDQEERAQLYRQAQQLALDEAVNIFGVSTPDFHVYSPNIKGLTYCPVMGSDEDFYWAWLED